MQSAMSISVSNDIGITTGYLEHLFTLMLTKMKNPQSVPLIEGGILWGFLRLWICGHKPVFQFVGTYA